MDNPFFSPSILSLCPGFLGLERGIQRAIGEIRVAAYVEIEAFIIANLIAGMETGMVVPAPVWTNVKTFDAKPFRKKIHGIIGGYPCQPFSLAGQRKGHEDPRHLWPHIHGIIKTAGPVWCFFENVSGHLSMGYDQVYKDLRTLGYAVEAGIFTAEEVGAPHERERLFILAISEKFIRSMRRRTPPLRGGWEGLWANIDWSGTGATMEFTGSDDRRLAEWEQGQQRYIQIKDFNIIRTSEMAYPGFIRPPWAQQQAARIDEPGKEFIELANTYSQPGQPVATTRLEVDGPLLPKAGRYKNTDGSQSFGASELGNAESQQLYRHGRLQPGGQPDTANNGKELANTESIGIQRLWTERRQCANTSVGERLSGCNSNGIDRWPAGPGSEQYP